MATRRKNRKGRPQGRPFILISRKYGGYRVDDLAVATAVAGNIRYTTDPDGLYCDLLGDLGKEKTERVWKLANEIATAYEEANFDDAA
jgi:hypothetical protein